MPVATRTFRVFVSSTFEDLKPERDALLKKAFPSRGGRSEARLNR